ILATAAVQPLVAQQSSPAAGQSAAPAGQTKNKEIKDPAEYNAYVNATQQTDPNQKATALESFLQTYPNSVMKIDAMELLMAAYQQAGNAQKTVDAANRILQVDRTTCGRWHSWHITRGRRRKTTMRRRFRRQRNMAPRAYRRWRISRSRMAFPTQISRSRRTSWKRFSPA